MIFVNPMWANCVFGSSAFLLQPKLGIGIVAILLFGLTPGNVFGEEWPQIQGAHRNNKSSKEAAARR